MLTMRNRPVEDLSFMEFLTQVKRITLEAYENQDYQFDELVERLGIEPQAGRNPLFDAQFTFQNAADAVRNQETIEVVDFRVTLVSSPVKRQSFDLGVNITEAENTYSVRFGYLTALFNHSTIENMAVHYEEILHQCMENKTVKIKDIVISLDLVTSNIVITGEDVTAFEF
jgi:fengycin family lipopeptide synthetase D